MSLVCARAAAFDGDPTSLARDNIIRYGILFEEAGWIQLDENLMADTTPCFMYVCIVHDLHLASFLLAVRRKSLISII